MATKAEILDTISSMTVLELSELIKEMEEKFGVSAAAAAVAVAAPAAGAAHRRGPAGGRAATARAEHRGLPARHPGDGVPAPGAGRGRGIGDDQCQHFARSRRGNRGDDPEGRRQGGAVHGRRHRSESGETSGR